MALLSLIASKAFRVGLRSSDKEGNEIGVLLIDATLSETTNYESEVTENPVEDGPDVADHVRPKPVSVDIEGQISETPLTLAGDLSQQGGSNIQTMARGFAGGVTNNIARSFGSQLSSAVGTATGIFGAKLLQSSTDIVKDSRARLEQMLLTKELVTLQLKHSSYKNMVMVRLSFPRTNEIGKSLRFSASFKQINIVTGETVEIKKIARSAPGAAKKAGLGNQPQKSPTADVTRKQSILHKGFEGLFGKVGGRQ